MHQFVDKLWKLEGNCVPFPVKIIIKSTVPCWIYGILPSFLSSVNYNHISSPNKLTVCISSRITDTTCVLINSCLLPHLPRIVESSLALDLRYVLCIIWQIIAFCDPHSYNLPSVYMFRWFYVFILMHHSLMLIGFVIIMNHTKTSNIHFLKTFL